MEDWNSNQYLKFKNQRTQPALDLAMRIVDHIADRKPRYIADIGCGPGNSTSVLKKLFPDADIIGIDNSPNMIRKAQSDYPNIKFRLCSAAELDGKYDLLFSNACLQWIPEHNILIPSLMDKLCEGGILAVQIPMNDDEPLFRIIREVAARSEWGLGDIVLQPNEILTPDEYYDILSDCSSAFDIWETKYCHSLENHQALVDWVKGTRMRPYLDYLGSERGAEFETEVLDMAKKVYPLRKNGNVVLGFRRLFFTAEK